MAACGAASLAAGLGAGIGLFLLTRTSVTDALGGWAMILTCGPGGLLGSLRCRAMYLHLTDLDDGEVGEE